MPKEVIPFESFLLDVNPMFHQYINELDSYLSTRGFIVNIESAKSGYVVSYTHKKTKKVVLNYVFRKSGVFARIYADNLSQYSAVIDGFHESVKNKLIAAPICKRLTGGDCNSRCPMGYTFSIKGDEYKKCRYNCFLILLTPESAPAIKILIENEAAQRG